MMKLGEASNAVVEMIHDGKLAPTVLAPGTAEPKLKWIRWRGGRPRAVFGPLQRARGHQDHDLKNADGSWFTLDQAVDFSREAAAAVKASRAADAAVKRLRNVDLSIVPRRGNDIETLLHDWEKAWPATMAKATRKSYRDGMAALLFKPQTRQQRRARRAAERAGKPVAREREPIGSIPPTAIGRPELRALHRYMAEARGVHMARVVIATLSAAFTWGMEDTKWRLPPNPRIGMNFEQPPGRVVLITMAEFKALVAAADNIGKPSIGDAFYLGLFTGQRQTDRIRMRDESGVAGRRTFRQSKTGQLVDIKEAPQLALRLDCARARVAAIMERLGLTTRPVEIVVNEDNGKPYADRTYQKWVTAIRWLAFAGRLRGESVEAAIARGMRQIKAQIKAKETPPQPALEPPPEAGDWQLEPCPSLAFINAAGKQDWKHDQDLRDTCVMLLDRAGCDLLMICNITGHSYNAAQTIIKHYRARNAARADQGIDRLALQVGKEGMAVPPSGLPGVGPRIEGLKSTGDIPENP